MRTPARALLIGAWGAAVAGGCKPGGKPAAGTGQQIEGRPVETQQPNAKDQQPAFAGQTRAPYRTANVAFDVQVVARGLDHPWSLAFLPGGAMLVTERPGRLRIVGKDGSLSEPVAGVPAVDARGQGGLLEVALDPAFADNGFVYLTYAEQEESVNGTALARGKLVRDGAAARLDEVQVLWRQQPKIRSTLHFGSRIVFDGRGAMFVTLGERSIDQGRKQAQRLDGTLGKVIRITTDGTTPKDNPFVDKKVDGKDVPPEIWSYGHRNVQAAALHPETGKLWVVDHGARGGDEINIVEAGKDYGWPTITYGIEYMGDEIGDGITAKPGMEQPIYYWDPVIAPSGMAFYTGDAFAPWKGSLLVGALAGKHVARLTLEGDRVVGEERLLADRGVRIRDVRQGPDGLVYLLTDEDEGELLRLAPAKMR